MILITDDNKFWDLAPEAIPNSLSVTINNIHYKRVAIVENDRIGRIIDERGSIEWKKKMKVEAMHLSVTHFKDQALTTFSDIEYMAEKIYNYLTT